MTLSLIKYAHNDLIKYFCTFSIPGRKFCFRALISGIIAGLYKFFDVGYMFAE
jgi:hypothetical protein